MTAGDDQPAHDQGRFGALEDPVSFSTERVPPDRATRALALLGVALLISLRPTVGGEVQVEPPVEALAAGVVHGPRAAFEIHAPEGWVLDNSSGADQGLPCVLYPEGESWGKAKAYMYAKIAAQTYEKRDDFVDYVIDFLRNDDPDLQHRFRAEGETADGHAWVLVEYFRPSYPFFDRSAYFQLPGAVGYVVYQTRDWDVYLETSPALEEVIESFRYRPDFIGHDEE